MFSNAKPFCRRKTSTMRSAIERLEERRLLSAGGGWTAGGLSGNYFANPDLTGPAAFSRSDVRLDFDWGTLHKPGGSISPGLDRKSTRLNSSHSQTSYAVFCLKKKIE